MALFKQGLCALAFEAAKKVIGAELEYVSGLLLEDFAVEGTDFVGVV